MHATISSSATRALISRSRLADAAAAALASGGGIADLRGDAYGHGIDLVAAAVLDAGARAVLVDSPAEVERLMSRGRAAVCAGAADIDSTVLYGLGGVRAPMRLVGRVMSTKMLREGDAVSYGYTYRAPTARRVALVTGGYAQGIVRSLGNRAAVELGGVLRPVVGRVAMDVCMVDLGEEDDAAVGDQVTFFGGCGAAAGLLGTWSRITGLGAGELITVAGRHAVREQED